MLIRTLIGLNIAIIALALLNLFVPDATIVGTTIIILCAIASMLLSDTVSKMVEVLLEGTERELTRRHESE